MINKEDLIVDEIYECDARNFTYGIWTGVGFEYIRHKFGMTYYFYPGELEYHYDDGAPYGTCKPLKLMEFKG